MNGDIWVLEKDGWTKALDGIPHPDWYRQRTVWAYSSFEVARKAFHRLIRTYAASENSIFDGDGNVHGFREYLDKIEMTINKEGAGEPDDPHFKMRGNAPDRRFTEGNLEEARLVPFGLRKWLLDPGSFKENPIPQFKWTDWIVGMVSRPGELLMGTLDWESQCERYDPELYVNAFDMSDPDRGYVFRIANDFEDRLGERTGWLDIRLARVRCDDAIGHIWRDGAFLDIAGYFDKHQFSAEMDMPLPSPS